MPAVGWSAHPRTPRSTDLLTVGSTIVRSRANEGRKSAEAIQRRFSGKRRKRDGGQRGAESVGSNVGRSTYREARRNDDDDVRSNRAKEVMAGGGNVGRWFRCRSVRFMQTEIVFQRLSDGSCHRANRSSARDGRADSDLGVAREPLNRQQAAGSPRIGCCRPSDGGRATTVARCRSRFRIRSGEASGCRAHRSRSWRRVN